VRKIAYIFVWLFIASIPTQELAASILVETAGTISKLVGLAAAMVGFAAIIYDGKLRPFMMVHGIIVLYFIWGSFTFFWSADQGMTYSRIVTNVQLLVMVLLLSQFSSREDETVGLIAAYCLGAALSLFELFRRFLTGASIVATLFNERYTAFENNPNDYALALGLAVPMGWYLASRRVSWWATILGYSVAGAAAVGVVLTGSRGGLVSMLVGAMIIPFTMFKLGWRERFAGIVVVLAGLTVAFSVTPEAVLYRLSTIEEAIDPEVPEGELQGRNIRTVIWTQGFSEFVTNPQAATIGVGAGAYQRGVSAIFGEEFVAHNVYISILLEQGILGFLLFITILFLLLDTIKYLGPAERYLWIFLFLTWGIGVLFMTWEHTKNTWFIIGLLAARGASAKYESDEKSGYLASLFRRSKVGLRLRRRPVY
jgi:O-antigen ligase